MSIDHFERGGPTLKSHGLPAKRTNHAYAICQNAKAEDHVQVARNMDTRMLKNLPERWSVPVDLNPGGRFPQGPSIACHKACSFAKQAQKPQKHRASIELFLNKSQIY